MANTAKHGGITSFASPEYFMQRGRSPANGKQDNMNTGSSVVPWFNPIWHKEDKGDLSNASRASSSELMTTSGSGCTSGSGSALTVSTMDFDKKSPDSPGTAQASPMASSGVAGFVVSLEGAKKAYGKGHNRKLVLDNFNMKVKKGAIYALLGASGCGKTTALSCLVGRRQLDEGRVTVFGGVPGDRRTGVPGKRVGYMPQELALYLEFTIGETLEYFGRIFNLDSSHVKEQIKFLLEFLDLPPQNRRIDTLSGGQQRRVSFAVSLLHNPELLILDEPTVGVDPMLRQSIWSHLLSLATEKSKTIIITTHYIEEARQASVVGLMRKGTLLAEQAPDQLLREHQAATLEQVFLQLCNNHTVEEENNGQAAAHKDNGGGMETRSLGGTLTRFATLASLDGYGSTGRKRTGNIVYPGITAMAEDLSIQPISYVKSSEESEFDKLKRRFSLKKRPSNAATALNKPQLAASSETLETSHCCQMPSPHKIWALVVKSLIKMWRNKSQLLFTFLLPAIQVIFFCVAIGRDPKNLPIALVNNEFLAFNESCEPVPGCQFANLSCRFISHLSAQESLTLINYPDPESGLAAVKAGRAWGLVTIPEDFSQHFLTRLWSAMEADEATINGSSIVRKQSQLSSFSSDSRHVIDRAVRVGAFNVRRFGKKKMQNETVVEILVKIIKRYDILLVQEIVDATEKAIYELLSAVNSSISDEQDQYDLVLSPRLGRTKSKEQYAFFYKKTRFRLKRFKTYPDPDDVFIREPFAVHWTTSSLHRIDSLVLVGVHVQPANAVKELDAMEDVSLWARKSFKSRNLLFLGDFNAGGDYVKSSDWPNIRFRVDKKNYHWLIPDHLDTTATSTLAAYDRIVAFGAMRDVIKSNSARVYRFDDELSLDEPILLSVSDHYPVEVLLEPHRHPAIDENITLRPAFSIVDRRYHDLDFISVEKSFDSGDFDLKLTYNKSQEVDAVFIYGLFYSKDAMLKSVTHLRDSWPELISYSSLAVIRDLLVNAQSEDQPKQAENGSKRELMFNLIASVPYRSQEIIVQVNLDSSNQQVDFVLQRSFQSGYGQFFSTLLTDCQFSESSGQAPLVFGERVYGSEEPNFTEFMAPGIIILIIFFLALALTGEVFIVEKKEGLMDRSFVAGVLPSEYVISFVLVQLLVLVGQAAITLVHILLVFKVPCEGPVGWLIGLTLLQGTAGMCYGLMLSAIFSDLASAMQLSIGSFYPNLLLSGIIWPVEGMPAVLQQICWYLPCTAACQAMRDVMARGWKPGTDPDAFPDSVTLGYIASVAWSAVFLVISWVVIKIKTT